MKGGSMKGTFGRMRAAPLPPASLVRVRAEVEKRTAGRRAWLAPWGALLAAAGAFWIAFLIRPATPPALPDSLARWTPAVPSLAVPLAAKATPVAKVSTRKPSRLKQVPSPAPPRQGGAEMLIRIETADPDVVILLVGD